MSADQAEIYRRHAEAYHRLVSREDTDGHLRPAIEAVCPLAGARVVEVGAGTGRLTRLLVSAGAEVLATEPEAAMREVARAFLADLPPGRVSLVEGRGDALPAPSGEADLCLAGWVFGHLRHWMPEGWREAVGACLDEMARVVRPGGRIVVIETLGTGRETPAPPNADLGEYYRWLEEARGFTRVALRTDYLFRDVEEAAELCGFFFGPEKAALVRRLGGARLPECTGLWWR